MILQTHTGEIQLLPALPAAWAAGSIKGLRARGGFELDVYWKEGRLSRVRVLSLAGQPCAVRYGNLRAKLELAAGQARELNGNLESQ
jgi:alpha-L-fucosidase 2